MVERLLDLQHSQTPWGNGVQGFYYHPLPLVIVKPLDTITRKGGIPMTLGNEMENEEMMKIPPICK